MDKKKYSTTTVTGADGYDSWGVIIEEFKTEKEAKAYIKKLKEADKSG